MDTDLASGKRTFASRLWHNLVAPLSLALLVLGAGVMTIVFILLRAHSTWPWLFFTGMGAVDADRPRGSAEP